VNFKKFQYNKNRNTMATDPDIHKSEIASQVEALQAPIANVRAAAARRLGQLKAGAEALVGALQDSKESVRVAAAQALAGIPAVDEAQHTLVLDHLLSAIDDPSDKVCQAAIWALGMRRETAASDQVAEMLSVSNPFIAGNALLALARMEDTRIAPELLDYLNHPNEYVRTQAVRAVALLRYAPAGPAILAMLTRLRAERTGQGMPRHAVVNHLFDAIAALQLTEAIPLLLDVARHDVGLRGKAVETLVALQAQEAAETLAHMLADPSTSLRRNLLHLMGEFKYLPAIPFIRPLLHDSQPAIRRAALNTLTRLGDRESSAAIEGMCFHDPSPFARVEAVLALIQLQGQAALPVLRALAADPNADVRRAVVSSLLELGTWGQDELRIAARFIADFPNDTLVARLQPVLADHPLPAPASPLPPSAPPAIPPALLDRREALAGLLQTWLAALPAQPESEDTRAALLHLLALLH
jgi:HEAT repeat protein